jgi:putative FmdB family regulatory protein
MMERLVKNNSQRSLACHHQYYQFSLNIKATHLVKNPSSDYNEPSDLICSEVVFMPVYTYRCDSCGVQFEQSQKFSDAPLTRCPECGKKALKKVYTPVGIVFKGSGFYATDHRSPSGQTRTPGSSNGESKPADGKSTGSASSTPSTESTTTSAPAKSDKTD